MRRAEACGSVGWRGGGGVDRAVGASRARGSVQGSGLALAFLWSRIPRAPRTLYPLYPMAG